MSDEFKAPEVKEIETPKEARINPDLQREIQLLNLEVQFINAFMGGKRLKQLCKPFNLSLKQSEDFLRQALKRRMVKDKPLPQETQDDIRAKVTHKPEATKLPKVGLKHSTTPSDDPEALY
jgi:hypothetical protein